MNYGIGNVKGKGGGSIPHITIELSQMLTSTTFQLTNEQYDLIDKNSAILFTSADGTSFLFKKTITSAFETLGVIALTCMLGDLVDNTNPVITEYRLGITKSTKIGTFSQGVVNGAVANPTLDGTEADLTGIQIGDTKYNVGGGGGGGSTIYCHNLLMSYTSGSTVIEFYLQILNNSSTLFNKTRLLEWLNTNTFNESNRFYQCDVISSGSHVGFGIARKDNSTFSYIESSTGNHINIASSSMSSVSDKCYSL